MYEKVSVSIEELKNLIKIWDTQKYGVVSTEKLVNHGWILNNSEKIKNRKRLK